MSNHPKTKQVLIKKKLKRKNNFSNDEAKSKTYQYFQKYEISQPFSIKGILSPNLNGISELFQKQVGSNNSLQPYFILWSFPSLQSLKAKNRVVSSSVLKDVQVNFTTRQPRREAACSGLLKQVIVVFRAWGQILMLVCALKNLTKAVEMIAKRMKHASS